VQLGKPVEGDSIRRYHVTCHLDSSAAMVTDGDLQRHGPFSARVVSAVEKRAAMRTNTDGGGTGCEIRARGGIGG
jgi:hypothetical protein